MLKIDLGYRIKNLHQYQWSSYPEYIGKRCGVLPAKYYLFKEFGGKDFKSLGDSKSFYQQYQVFVEQGISDRIEKKMAKYLLQE